MRLQKSASQSFSLPLEILELLDVLSHELRVSKSQILREALAKELPLWEAKLKTVARIAEPAGAGRES